MAFAVAFPKSLIAAWWSGVFSLGGCSHRDRPVFRKLSRDANHSSHRRLAGVHQPARLAVPRVGLLRIEQGAIHAQSTRGTDSGRD